MTLYSVRSSRQQDYHSFLRASHSAQNTAAARDQAGSKDLKGSCNDCERYYSFIHNRDKTSAIQRLKSSSNVAGDFRAPLEVLLSESGVVYDLPEFLLPRTLRSKALQGKKDINIGKHKGVVRTELGRGGYGVVVLLDVDCDKRKRDLAVKAQSPTDCLAWEYEVLKRVEQRIGSITQGVYPFPKPMAFISLADGGMMSMTAGSKSGLNLVDLVNVYKVRLGEPVPEIIALHYTARMLQRIEVLHFNTKVLVR